MKTKNKHRHKKKKLGFTITELLIVIVLIAILILIVINVYKGLQERAYYNRAVSELHEITKATDIIALENGAYPPDTTRDLPSEVIDRIGNKNWPKGPWPGSVYDWDNFVNNGQQTYQVSIRFCPAGEPQNCKFPNELWAKNFQVDSSLYYCMQGSCKSHPNQPQDYPGYCINC